MLKELKGPFLQDCDQGMLRDVIASMDTPLGLRMTELELKEQDPRTGPERIVFPPMRLHPPGDTRHDLVIAMDDATETSKMSWDMVAAMTKAIAAKRGPSLSDSDFAALQQKFQPLLRTGALFDLLFIYRQCER